MAGVADSAVGAILEIPDDLLTKIKTAEDKIKSLGATSESVAKEVSNHWGTIAPDGLQKFIDKIAEAKKTMDGLGTINVTLNTQSAVQSTEQLSSATQKTSADVSKAVQDMAQSYDVLAKVDISGVRKIAEDEVMSIEKIKAKIKELEAELKIANVVSSEGVLNPNIQKIADEKKAWEEYIRIITEASKIKEKALEAVVAKQDKVYLDEQKRLLAEILDLRKQVNGQKIIVAQGQVTGSSTLEQDKKILSDLIARLYEAKDKLKEYNAEKYKNVSAEGQAKAQVNTLNQENALIKEQMSFREKLNSAIARGNELVAQTQAGKARLGSSDESVAQRQLNSDYKEMLKIIKEQGELKAKVASEGRQMNQDEINLIATLAQRYRTYYDDIKRVEGAYTNMAQASAQAFQNDKTAQMSRNAVLLADAQNKAAEAAQKVADAQAKAAQQQATKDRSQAESDLNRLYTERLRLLKEKEQLENKALVNTAKGLPDLTAKENQLLAEVTAKIQQIEGQIQNIGNSYAGLTAKTRHAFALDELRQATDLQNQFNKALDAVDTSRTKQLVAEYKKLYAENEKLFASMRKYYNDAGGTPTSAMTGTRQVDDAYRQIESRHTEVLRQMRDLESKNIQEIADFRMQKSMEANQRSISEFIQAEAQKTAEAKKQAEQQSNDRIQAYQRFLNTYQGAMAAANRLGTRGGWEDTYENRARVIKNLEAAIKSLNKADADYEKKLKDLTDALNRLKSAQDSVKLSTKPVISSQDALNMAKSATTLRELEAAYKALKEAMANTKASDPQWAQMNTQLQKTKTHIDEIKKKMGEFHGQASKTNNVLNQLQGRIAAAFSIGAITGFIKKMVEVRAQFELQRVALGAIIQDKDEANKIFLQVQKMALESPFSIMQLERATKQIAAFGFETQKLVPTMKMFADISAGLGVEIDRLVLVMGHLKARNFLEGTMVRQFTNMGFNILGNLSKYYSELEGRMVAVGEVQDRVKKKMISFEDVEEVLKRVTSAGGMFYDMQKKQSDSLWGQMQRIKDAYDLMLNEIGQSNESSIKGALTLIRTLINSWRELKPYIVSAVTAMTSYMVVAAGWKVITTLITGSQIAITLFTKGLQAAKLAQQSLNVTMASNPYAAVAAALLALSTYIYQVVNATSKLEDEMSRIGADMTDSLNESIATFKKLADTISSSNSTYTERTEAMTDMRRIYAEILPQEKLEIAYIQSLRGDYAELTKAIQDYYQQKEYQQKMEAVQGSDEADKLKKQVESTLMEMNKEGMFDLKYSKAQIKSWAETLSKEMLSGKLNASIESLDKRIKDIFNAKDLSSYWEESYGKADMHDIIQAYQKVADAQGDITIETANAENAMKSYQETLNRLDISQLTVEQKALEQQRDSLQKALKEGVTYTGYGTGYVTQRDLGSKEIEEYTLRLNSVEAQIKAVDEAQQKWLANQFKEEVDTQTKKLTDQVQKYWDAKNAMESLEMQGKANTDEWKREKDAMDGARKSADEFAETFNTKVDWAVVNSAQTSFELRGELDKLATNAFPKVAEFALRALSNVQKYLLQTQGAVLGMLQKLGEILPDNLKNAIPGAAKIFGAIDERLALTKEQLAELDKSVKDTGKNASDAGDNFGKIVSDQAIKHVEKFGANMSDIDGIIKDTTKGASEMAKELRGRAKTWEETVKKYNTAPDKSFFLEANKLTKEQIDLYEKNAKAAEALAADLDGVNEKTKKTASGKDPVLEMYKRRNDAIKRYYEGAEKARKNLSELETKEQQMYSFTKLWSELGLNEIKGLSLNELLAQGFNPDYLKNQYVEALKILKNVIPSQYADLKKEIEKQIASESIEIQFKITEKERERLQKSITDMFDNYALTKELSDLGVNIDLTYMVGGKPTTLADIRQEYSRLMVDFSNKSEEEQKIIKKMGEDLMKKEYDNRKKQLNNYIKYLTESMGERAQIEIKALQDVNKIREDDTLDQFSKEQAVIQRRKKMYEDLSKFDFDQFKGSDVYLTVFKDLETASKEQLQFVINKLKEMQSTFKDLSPVQVKSIANEIKKMEDALAGKDAVKNLSKNLADAIKYARNRNALLREQTSLQSQIGTLEKSLSSEQEALYELEIKREAVQDKSSDEWKEANEEVRRQRMIVSGLESQIEVLQDKQAKVTEEINKGTLAWKSFQAGMASIRNGMNQLKDSFGSVFTGLDSMGLVNDAFRDTYESITDIIGGLDTFLGGLESIDVMKPFSIITGSIKAIGGIFQSIGGVFGIGDKKKERSIQRLVEKVDTLDKAYQKLEKSIEKAYAFSDYKAGYSQMQKTLNAEKSAYEEMLALEKAKKKTDKEKVKQYEDALEEIAEKQKDLQKSLIEDFGSTTDYRGAAEDFVSAWLDAFKETGDGLDALNENWQEFIQNLFIKQAALAKAGDVYKDVIDIINNAMTKGKTDFDLKESIAQAQEAANKGNEYMNNYLKALAEAFNIRPDATGELILSDLQKGIQNITEPQAAAIEVYLNSMRFAVFRHTEQLDTLITAIQAQYGSGAENPVVTELKGIRGVLDNIYSTLRSVVNTQGRNATLRIGT